MPKEPREENLTPKMELDDVLGQIARKKIEGIEFEVVGYAHYGHCKIAWEYEYYPAVSMDVETGIGVWPSKDEYCYFDGPVNPDEKIFHIPGRGKLSLRMMWKDIRILKVLPKERTL